MRFSEEQIKYARERIEKAGLSDMVDFKLQDYRDEKGTYDGIASIEMFEAVGEQYWPAYFNTVRDRLKPGKNATLQIITVQDRRWEVYKRGVDFIQKYIFPGGMLPSPKALRAQVVKAGLSIERSIEFGPSYSISLRRWHDTFNERWDQIAAMGFDDRFRRMWNFYLRRDTDHDQTARLNAGRQFIRSTADQIGGHSCPTQHGWLQPYVWPSWPLSFPGRLCP